MQRRSGKRVAAAVVCIGLAFASITGCTVSRETAAAAAQHTETIYSSDGLKIEREGAKTYVYDLAGSRTYTFTKRRVKKDQAAKIREVSTTSDTATVRIQLVGGGVMVTVKETGEAVFIP